MKPIHLAAIGLQLRLWLTRRGWSKLLAGVLLAAGAGAWLGTLPRLERQVAASRAALAAAQIALAGAPPVTAAPPLPPAEQRLQQFHDALGESRYAEQQLKTLFALAAKNSLTLRQAEYKFAYDKNGLFHTYAVALPVKGPYTAIRPFCEQVLLAIPFASLDAVDFKRDAVNNPTLDAKLRFTLYLDNAEGMAGTAEAADLQGAEP